MVANYFLLVFFSFQCFWANSGSKHCSASIFEECYVLSTVQAGMLLWGIGLVCCSYATSNELSCILCFGSFCVVFTKNPTNRKNNQPLLPPLLGPYEHLFLGVHLKKMSPRQSLQSHLNQKNSTCADLPQNKQGFSLGPTKYSTLFRGSAEDKTNKVSGS